MDVDLRTISASPSSFRSMYREHYGLVWGAARRFGVDDHLLDDAVQEAFIVAYRRLSSFDGRSPKAWLYGITRRVASNVRRSERRTTRRKDAAEHVMRTVPSRSTETVEAWQAVDHFLEGLSERQREIFVLSELEGMTGAEVARSLSLRPSTTYDAIRALRRRFADEVELMPDPGALQGMARRERPRATARSWSALVAAMPGAELGPVAPASSVTSWSAMSLGAKVTLASLGAAAVLVVGIAVGGDEPARADRRATATTPVRAAADVPTTPSAGAAEPIPLSEPEPAPTEATEPSSEPEPEPTASPVPAPPAATPASTAPAAPRSLAAENALLRDAAAFLAAGEPARALALADRHAKEHAGSPMVDISTALRIESLCALGKAAQARGEAAVFLRRRPGSPMADRIRGACPEESTSAP